MTTRKKSIEYLNINETEEPDLNLSECEFISKEMHSDFDCSDITDNKNNRSSSVFKLFGKKNIIDDIKLTPVEKYGVEAESQSNEVINKMPAKSLEKYNVDYVLQSKIDLIGAGC